MAEFRKYIKSLLFLSSYIPLYLIISIRIHGDELLFYTLRVDDSSVKISWATIILIILSILLAILLLKSITSIKQRGTETKQVHNFRLRNELLASYLLVYVFVFAGLDFHNSADILIFLLFFGLMYAIQIRSEILYINPLLAIFGYRVYEVTSDTETVLVISQGKLEERLDQNNNTTNGKLLEIVPMESGSYITPDND